MQISQQLEQALIREISNRCASVLATVPLGDERAASALEKALGCNRTKSDEPSGVNSLSSAKQHLFAESTPPVSALDESLKLSNWPGEPRECVEIVRSIQAEAARGVPFDQMAVFLNSPGEYRSHLEEAFNRAQIPVYFAQGSTAPDPSGRAMLGVAFMRRRRTFGASLCGVLIVGSSAGSGGEQRSGSSGRVRRTNCFASARDAGGCEHVTVTSNSAFS